MSRRAKRFLKVALIFLSLLVLVSFGLFWFPQLFLCVDSGPVKADLIILLGGGAHERPDQAARLFLNHDAPRILISGAGDDTNNRRVLIRDGVPARAIELESKSKSTRENARFCTPILHAEKVRTVIIVTSWYHSRRALKTFEHFDPDIRFYSRPSYFDFKRSQWNHDFSRRIYWEYVKLPGYWVGYGIWPF